MDMANLAILLDDLGITNRIEHDDWYMCSCFLHKDNHPSCGISASKEVWHCFSCGGGGNLVSLISQVKDIPYEEARDIYLNFCTEKHLEIDTLRRYEDVLSSERAFLTETFLAPYHSGKIEHPYMTRRGFTKEFQQEYEFGWDSEKKRVTIPIRWENGTLCGVVGRAVLDTSNPSYEKIYGNSPKYYFYELPKGGVLFPLNKFEGNDSLILVEGTLDVLYAHSLGYRNTLALQTSHISKEQIKQLDKLGVKKIILCLDNDIAGEGGCKNVYDQLKGSYVFKKVVYPKNCKDLNDMDKEQIDCMLKNVEDYPKVELKRID